MDLVSLLLNLALTAVAVIIAAYVLPGIRVNNFGSAFFVAVILAILNYLAFRFVPGLVTGLGLDSVILRYIVILLVNVLFLYIADWMVKGFRITSFVAALLFSLVMALARWAIVWLIAQIS